MSGYPVTGVNITKGADRRPRPRAAGAGRHDGRRCHGCGRRPGHPAADGRPLRRAGWLAASIWGVGVGARTAFAIAASNGVGPAIARFSVAHQVTGSAAFGWRRWSCGAGRRAHPAGGSLPAWPSAGRRLRGQPRYCPGRHSSRMRLVEHCALVCPQAVVRHRSDSGELDAALLCQPMIVAEDSGEVGQERVVTLLGHLVVTRCGGPVRHRMLASRVVRCGPADDVGALVRQMAAEIGGRLGVAG